MHPSDISGLAAEDYCYLTTAGRVTGKPRRIEIWFGMEGGTLYLLSGGRQASDWVKNLKKDPHIEVRIGQQTFAGLARIVTDAAEDQKARQLLAAKYYNWRPGRRLNSWARTSLPIALDLDPMEEFRG